MIRFPLRGLAFVAGLVLLSRAALAADPTPSAPPDPTPAQRQSMATVHRKMADCLASTRPIAECRAEMQANCVQMMGQSGCPMMGGGMMPGTGMMQGQGMMRSPGMMGGSPPPPQPPK